MNNQREEQIISVAAQALPVHGELSEAEIDSRFILNFDPLCNQWLQFIWTIMREVLNLEGSSRLPQIEGYRWLWHLLEFNKGLEIHIVNTPKGNYYSGKTGEKGYRCINEDLQAALDKTIELRLFDEDELTAIAIKYGAEALKTRTVNSA